MTSTLTERLRDTIRAVADAIPVRAPSPAQAPVQPRRDGWSNVISGIGQEDIDPRRGGTFKRQVYLSPEQLDALYIENAIAARVIDLPVDESWREPVELDSDEDPDAVSDLSAALEDLGVAEVLAQAQIWGRLYGGGIVVMGLDDGQEPSSPVNERGLRTVDWLEPLDRWSVTWDETDPDYYTLHPQRSHTGLIKAVGGGMGQRIHASRVLRFGAITLPPRQRALQQGWDAPELTRVYNALQGEGEGFDAAGGLIHRTNQPVMKMRDLASQVLANGVDYVRDRLKANLLTRSHLNMMFVDADGEDFYNVPAPVAGLADLIDRFPLRVCAAAGMPYSLLYGAHPGGFSNADLSGERFFYDRVRARQQMRINRPALARILELLMLSRRGPTRGRELDVSIDFAPLWTPTPKEEAEIYKIRSEADGTNIKNGVLHKEEVAQSRFGGRRYGHAIQLDDELRAEKASEEPPLPPPPPPGDDPDPTDDPPPGDDPDASGDDPERDPRQEPDPADPEDDDEDT